MCGAFGAKGEGILELSREMMKKQLNVTLAGLGLEVKPSYRPEEVQMILAINHSTFEELINRYVPDPFTGEYTNPKSLDSFILDQHRVTYFELVDYLVRNQLSENGKSGESQKKSTCDSISKYQKYRQLRPMRFSKTIKKAEKQLKEMLEVAGIEEKLSYRSVEIRKLFGIDEKTFLSLVHRYEKDPETGLLKDPLSLPSSKFGYRIHRVSHAALGAFLVRNNTYEKAHSAYK